MCAEHKDTDRPEAWLRMLFSQEFRVGRKGFGEKEEKKSSLCFMNIEKKRGLDRIQGRVWQEAGLV